MCYFYFGGPKDHHNNGLGRGHSGFWKIYIASYEPKNIFLGRKKFSADFGGVDLGGGGGSQIIFKPNLTKVIKFLGG